jgi:hypothetical protein
MQTLLSGPAHPLGKPVTLGKRAQQGARVRELDAKQGWSVDCWFFQ